MRSMKGVKMSWDFEHGARDIICFFCVFFFLGVSVGCNIRGS